MEQHNKKKEETEDKKKLFLQKYMDAGCNASKACKAAKVGRTTVWRWTKEDDDFAEKLSNAKEELIDEVEDILMMKIRGFEKSVAREKVDKNGAVVPYKVTYYFPPCFQSIQLKLIAMARHRGYGMKPDDSDAGQHVDDE